LAAPLSKFHDCLLDTHDKLAPRSLLGKAVGYTMSQWPKLMRYLDDPVLGPDTNPTERAGANGHEPVCLPNGYVVCGMRVLPLIHDTATAGGSLYRLLFTAKLIRKPLSSGVMAP